MRRLHVFRAIHILSLGLWAGGAVFFSFGVAPKIFGYLQKEVPNNPPRELYKFSPESGRSLAGKIVGAIFPSYFAWQEIAGTVALVTGFLLAWRGRPPDRIRVILILVACACVLIQWTWVLPHSTALLDEMDHVQVRSHQVLEEQLRMRFHFWHGFSQSFNLMTIVAVVVALAMAGAGESRATRQEIEPARTN